MELLRQIFGEGKNLNIWQMSCRGIVVFVIALVLIRLAGRRSFGIRAPLDNIITIMLGAILSRAVVGASDFLPVIVCCFVIVLLHRFFSWSIVNNTNFGRFVEGDKIPLFKEGRFVDDGLERAQLSKEDVMQGVRRTALTENMDKIDKVYIERSGEISAVKKD